MTSEAFCLQSRKTSPGFAARVVFRGTGTPSTVGGLRVQRATVKAGSETCCARNVARHEAAGAAGGDGQMVGRETPEALYLHDDQDASVQYLKDQDSPVLVVGNEAKGK